jgi:hypothetical protein
VPKPTLEHAAYALALKLVATASPLASHRDDASRFEHREVPSGRRPTVLKSRCEIARVEFAGVPEEQHDVAPRLVGECGENEIDVVK